MRILVLGSGAIGSVLGGFLAKDGHEVTLLGRAWHLDVIRREGLTISGLWGTHQIRNLSLVMDSQDIQRPKEFDWVFVCVKSYDTTAAAKMLGQFLGPQTLVCAFQNGLGNYETLTQHLAADRVALGRVIFGVEIEPGHVTVTVCADDVLIGAPDPYVPHERLHELASALNSSGVPCRTSDNILTALWGKVLYNCALNGLSTLLEVPYGKLLEHSIAPRLMEAIIKEAYQVAEAHKVQLEPPTAQAYIDLLFTRLIPDTAAHHPSMLQDLRRGKPPEIDAMNGALVRLANQARLQVPVNTLITHLVHLKESTI